MNLKKLINEYYILMIICEKQNNSTILVVSINFLKKIACVLFMVTYAKSI